MCDFFVSNCFVNVIENLSTIGSLEKSVREDTKLVPLLGGFETGLFPEHLFGCSRYLPLTQRQACGQKSFWLQPIFTFEA